MEDFATFLIAPLLTEASSLDITIQGNTITATVPQAQMGKLIGKAGNSIKHLRSLIRTYCRLHQLPSYFLSVQPK